MDYSDGTAYTMGIFILATCFTLVYLILDLCLKGLVWYIWTCVFVPWWQGLFFGYPTNEMYAKQYTNNNNTRKDDGVVYCNHTTYNGQRMNDVWVETYIDPECPEKGFTGTKYTFFNGAAMGYEWRWLVNHGAYGWRQKEPPKPAPVPTIIVSDGIKDQVDSFLKGYRANEITKRAQRAAKMATKPADPVEKAPIQ